MAVRLTDAGIRALPVRRTRYDTQDQGTGLRLRTWPTGARTWAVVYRAPDGTQRRMALGPYGPAAPALTLAAARKRAAQVRADVQRGADPQAARRAARAAGRARRDAPRLDKMLDAFLKDQAPTWRPATKAGWERYVRADIVPALGKRVPSEITPDDVVHFLAALKRTRGPVSVARCFEVLRRAFRWAAARRLVPASPCANLDARELVVQAAVSDRVYTDHELVAILAGAAATELRLLVPMILYTGARSQEARSAEWKDIDKAARLWTIPASKSKTGERRRVPLCPGALAVLDELPDGRWLFPAHTSAGYIDRSSKAVDKVRQVSGVPDFGLHHLRRTLRQRMTDAGVALHVAEAVLGHLPPKIVRAYSPQWEPLADMRTALEAWGQRLAIIARG